MTTRPYLEDAAGDIDLGSTKSEDINGTQPVISASKPGGQSKDNIHEAIIAGGRTITIRAEKKFTTQTDMNTFFRRLDELKKGGASSAKLYAGKITEPYSGQTYFEGFITRLDIEGVERSEPLLLTYTFDFIEGVRLA